MTTLSYTKRRARCQVCAIVPIHQRDADLYLDQLFAEFDRLDWDVAWHINNMDKDTASRIIEYDRTLGYGISDGDFVDQDRNYAVNIAEAAGAKWLSPHDADETLEPDAPDMVKDFLTRRHHYVVRWYNIWEIKPDGTLMIRMDSPFIGYKARFYPVGPWTYQYKPCSASLYAVNNDWCPREDSGLRILHWGFSTPESRRWHFNRWDGKIDSDYWKGLVDPEVEALCRLKAFDPTVPHQVFVTT